MGSDPGHNSRPLLRTAWLSLLLLLSSALFVAIIVAVQLTAWAEDKSSRGLPLEDSLKADVSVTLGVIRTLQALLSATTSLAILRALLCIQWGLIRRPDGLSYLSLLALSRSTADWGTLRLIFGRGSSWTSQNSGILKYAPRSLPSLVIVVCLVALLTSTC